MNKIKELWAKNKVLLVLLMILIVCFIAILIVCITFFFGGNKSTYGDRLDEMDKYPITETLKDDYITSLEQDDLIKSAKMTTKGRVVYIRIELENDTPLVEAQSKATASLEKFSDDLLSYYDLNFTLYCGSTDNSEGYTIMGAKNSKSASIVWNNNTKVESEEEE